MKINNKQAKSFSLGFFIFVLSLGLTGCADDNNVEKTGLLSDSNINLIFVTSADITYNEPGDINDDTANLTAQGLQRSLMMASYLKDDLLGSKNVTSIYALSPMTHLQTANHYPDMTAIGSIQQFALLNQNDTLVDDVPYSANSYPIKASYSSADSLPVGVAAPARDIYCPSCKGLDFKNTDDNNVTLVSDIIAENKPGFYVFSAPWEVINELLEKLNIKEGYNLNVASTYEGANIVYAISITPLKEVSLVAYDSKLNPTTEYPELPTPIESSTCSYSLQPALTTSREDGVDGSVTPANINTNETIYIVRHAEAHPDLEFENGNFVAAGQWRALQLKNALEGKISPDMVYSIDPAQWYPAPSGVYVSYVRPSLTVIPYVIANNLPYHLVSEFYIADKDQAKLATDFFFTDGDFSNQTILLAWESSRIKPLINDLLARYGGTNTVLLPKVWPGTDYDTIWKVTLDKAGNVTVDNNMCEGINSADLSATAPKF